MGFHSNYILVLVLFFSFRKFYVLYLQDINILGKETQGSRASKADVKDFLKDT